MWVKLYCASVCDLLELCLTLCRISKIKMTMKFNESKTYESPVCYTVEIVTEGVLCASVDHEGVTGDEDGIF